MSVAVMSRVWELDLESHLKLTLLAFADHANDQGRCFPALQHVAWKSGVSKRTARRHVKELESRGLLDVDTGGSGRGDRSTFVVRPEKGDRLSPYRSEKGDTRRVEKGDTRDEEGTVNKEPSRSKAGAGAKNGDLFDDVDDGDAIRDVWDHYCRRYAELHSESRADRMSLDACDRRSKIRARFREGYRPNDLKRAIDGCFYDDWHRARSKVELEYIIRNQTKTEDFITRFEQRESDRSGGATDHPTPDQLGWGDEG